MYSLNEYRYDSLVYIKYSHRVSLGVSYHSQQTQPTVSIIVPVKGSHVVTIVSRYSPSHVSSKAAQSDSPVALGVVESATIVDEVY